MKNIDNAIPVFFTKMFSIFTGSNESYLIVTLSPIFFPLLLKIYLDAIMFLPFTLN